MVKNLLMRFFLSILFCCSLGPIPAYSFTYLLVNDADMLRQSDIVLSGKVIQVYPVMSGEYVIATRYSLEVNDVIKGVAPASVDVDIPGTALPYEKVLVAEGAPHYRNNDEVIFFLAPKRDGRYQLQQYAMGAFELKTLDGVQYAVRELGGVDLAAQFELSTEHREASSVRVADRFIKFLKQPSEEQINKRVAGKLSNKSQALSADYFVTDAGIRARLQGRSQTAYSLDYYRWENGGTIVYHPFNGSAYRSQLSAAANAWNLSGTSISLSIGSDTTDKTVDASMTQNVILFGDPNNQIGGSYSCDSGGTLAFASGYSRGTHKYKGTTYRSNDVSMIVAQNGVECELNGYGKKNAVEVLAHEMGHTLGLGHDSSSDALMFPYAHLDGRGAGLKTTDVAGATYLYEREETDSGSGSNAGAGAPPSISGLTDVVFYQGESGSANLNLTLLDQDTIAAELTVSIKSRDENVLPSSAFYLTGTGTSRTLKITASTINVFSAAVDVTVSDGESSVVRTILVTVEARNLPPSIDGVMNQTISVSRSSTNKTVVTIPFTVVDEAPEVVRVTPLSFKTSYFASNAMSVSGVGKDRVLTITAPINTGTVSAQLSLNDGKNNARHPFTLTFIPLNEPPVLSEVPSLTLQHGAAAQISFNVADSDNDLSDLVTKAASSNNSIVGDLSLSGTSTQRTLSLKGVNAGVCDVTISVTDGVSVTSYTFTVTVEEMVGSVVFSLSNDGIGSLRSIIEAMGEGGTVTFDPTVFAVDKDINNNQIIRLDRLLMPSVSMSINGDIDNDGLPDVTITGSEGVVAVTGIELTLQGMVLADSQETALIVDADAVVDIVDSAFLRNFGEKGGAIYNEGIVALTHSLLKDNQATTGGAVYNKGAFLVERSSLIFNSTRSFGGAVYNAAQADITNTTIAGNISENAGGALFNSSSGQLHLNNSTVTENRAVNGNGNGLYQSTGTTVLENSIFSENGSLDISNAGGELILDHSLILAMTGSATNNSSFIGLSGQLLQPVSMNGMLTIYNLGTTSPAIDNGNENTCSAVQAHNTARPIDGNNDGIPVCDMGATEADVMISGDPINQAYVRLIQEQYVAFYGRPGDPAGIRYWVGQLAEVNGNLSEIQRQFGNSVEFSDLIIPGNAKTVEELAAEQRGQLVSNLYFNMFGRVAEGAYEDQTTGLGYWTQVLADPKVTLMDIASRIAEGATNDDRIILNNRVSLATRISLAYSDSGREYTNNDIEKLRTFIDQNIGDAEANPDLVDLSGL
jgi:hypothetical protein